MEDFEIFREASRQGISDAGGEPVLVNEDFPAVHTTPRNACLDGVESCDILLSVVGSRGGWVAPSGRLVVEEEYEHARNRKLPVLAFLQDTQRDSAGEDFAKRLSNYVDGRYRRAFRTPEELRELVRDALQPLITTLEQPVRDMISREELTSRSRLAEREPTLRVIIRPERAEELIDPVRLASQSFTTSVYELGHRAGVGLFDYRCSKRDELAGGALIVHQTTRNERNSECNEIRLELDDNGGLMGEMIVTSPGNNRDLVNYIVSSEAVGDGLRRFLGFYLAFIELLDPYKRHQTFWLGAGLLGLGYRTLERSPKPRTSYTMRMSGVDEPLVAGDSPRKIARQDLEEPSAEIERALSLIERAYRPSTR